MLVQALLTAEESVCACGHVCECGEVERGERLGPPRNWRKKGRRRFSTFQRWNSFKKVPPDSSAVYGPLVPWQGQEQRQGHADLSLPTDVSRSPRASPTHILCSSHGRQRGHFHGYCKSNSPVPQQSGTVKVFNRRNQDPKRQKIL